MRKIALSIISVLLFLYSQAIQAQETSSLPNGLQCNVVLASGEIVTLALELGEEAKLLALSGSNWALENKGLTVTEGGNYQNRIWTYDIVDEFDMIRLQFHPLASVPQHFGIHLVHQGGSSGGNILGGNGICSQTSEDQQAISGAAGLTRVIALATPTSSGLCTSIDKDGNTFTFIARPVGDGTIRIEPESNGPITDPIDVLRSASPPSISEYEEFVAEWGVSTIAINWLTSRDLETRGEFRLTGADLDNEWTLVIDIWAINGEKSARTFLASHCGGFVE